MIFRNTVHDYILLSVPAIQAEIFDDIYQVINTEVRVDIVSV